MQGAAPLLISKEVLSAAGAILGTEAYHGGILRTTLINAANVTVPGYSFSVATAAQVVSNLRNAVDGPSDDDQGIIVNGMDNPVPTDANGLVYARTYCQVLSIVYLGSTTKGGFYPDGMNGKYKAC